MILFLMAQLLSLPAFAELMGLVPGRSANVDRQATSAVELGGGTLSGQLQWATARFNVKPTHNLVVYADVARLNVNDHAIGNAVNTGFNGTGFGGGLIFEVSDFFNAYDFAFNTSYHASTIADGASLNYRDRPVSANLEQRQLNAQFLVSPIDPILENGLTWYGSFGYVTTTRQTLLSGSETPRHEYIRYEVRQGFAYGVGLVLPSRVASVYVGAQVLASDLLFGAGIRFEFN